ncbi:MAG: twin-arginine translocase TatA/TatE family subunit [Acidimicrobiales bacterium]
MLLAEIIGPDILIILAVVALLFGGSQLPKLARSLGSAKAEFEKGSREGATADDAEGKAPAKAKADTTAPGDDTA